MKPGMSCELLSWEHFYDLCRDLAGQIRDADYRPDLIVAIGRGGWMAARILSDFLGNANLCSFRIVHYHGSHVEPQARLRYSLSPDVAGQQVLLVDDVSDSGETFAVALKHIGSRLDPTQVRSAVLHHKTTSSYQPDYYGEQVTRWRWIVYPWAVLEDLADLITSMDNPPTSIEEVSARMQEQYAIQPSRQQIEDALRFIDYARFVEDRP